MSGRGYDYHAAKPRQSLRRLRQRDRWLILVMMLVGGGMVALLVHLCLIK